MAELIYYPLLLLVSLVALARWRTGLYLALVIDVVRDPVRKLAPNQPVLVTVAGAAVWGAVLVGALAAEMPEIQAYFRRYRNFRTAAWLLMAAILPGTLLALVLYSEGWKLAVIGGATYIGPIFGLIIGYAFIRSEREAYRLLAFYSVLNALVLIGTPLEYLGYTHPSLGGIKMDWIRHMPGYVVHLIAGFYRSPDVMGLHAAHVVMFSSMLAMNDRSRFRGGWLLTAVWAGFCLMLGGRRKMIGMPLVFLAAFLGLGALRGARQMRKATWLLIISCLVGVGALAVLDTAGVGDEYSAYASTLVSDGARRTNQLVSDSIVWTIKQNGWLGGGLGSATQGKYYVSSADIKSWQEDGVSRLFMELGAPGVVILVFALGYFVRALRQAVTWVPITHQVQHLQLGLLSVGAANAASFVISHQQYSGDPVTLLFATVLVGIVFGAPRVYAIQTARLQQQLQFHGARPDSTKDDEDEAPLRAPALP